MHRPAAGRRRRLRGGAGLRGHAEATRGRGGAAAGSGGATAPGPPEATHGRSHQAEDDEGHDQRPGAVATARLLGPWRCRRPPAAGDPAVGVGSEEAPDVGGGVGRAALGPDHTETSFRPSRPSARLTRTNRADVGESGDATSTPEDDRRLASLASDDHDVPSPEISTVLPSGAPARNTADTSTADGRATVSDATPAGT